MNHPLEDDYTTADLHGIPLVDAIPREMAKPKLEGEEYVDSQEIEEDHSCGLAHEGDYVASECGLAEGLSQTSDDQLANWIEPPERPAFTRPTDPPDLLVEEDD